MMALLFFISGISSVRMYFYFRTILHPNMYRIIFSIFCLLSITKSVAQFPPQVGNIGSTAIHRDSNIIKAWAVSCTIQRGWQHAGDTSLGKATVGDETTVAGAAGNGVVSLGDGGTALITFTNPIKNDAGADFVVFENGFIDQSLDTGTAYLELAFVEVSSDGIHFFRFPSVSLTDTLLQTDAFGGLVARSLNNLAGKYIAPFGTPFDLDELPDTIDLDKHAITHVKLIDVVGSMNDSFAMRDSYRNKINDPWPTPFPASGFDLDAIGVIHRNLSIGMAERNVSRHITCYPNPVSVNQPVIFSIQKNEGMQIRVFDILGKICDVDISDILQEPIQIRFQKQGIYFVELRQEKDVLHSRVQVVY